MALTLWIRAGSDGLHMAGDPQAKIPNLPKPSKRDPQKKIGHFFERERDMKYYFLRGEFWEVWVYRFKRKITRQNGKSRYSNLKELNFQAQYLFMLMLYKAQNDSTLKFHVKSVVESRPPDEFIRVRIFKLISYYQSENIGF